MTTGSQAAENARIRSEILETPGAMYCPRYPDCEIITQGGETGRRLHVATVHGTGARPAGPPRTRRKARRPA